MTGEPSSSAGESHLLELVAGWIAAPDSVSVNDLDDLLAAVDLFPPETLRRIAAAPAELLDKNPAVAVDVALKLMGSEEPATRAFAAILIGRFARYQPAMWIQPAAALAADPVWEVRGHAARIFDVVDTNGGAVEFHTDFVFSVIHEWTRDGDYLKRHSATQALIGYAVAHLEHAGKVLALIEPLCDDESEYVRSGAVLALRNIGRKRPPLVLSFIELRLDNLGKAERETYLTLLDEHFAPSHRDWKQKLIHALKSPPEQNSSELS